MASKRSAWLRRVVLSLLITLLLGVVAGEVVLRLRGTFLTYWPFAGFTRLLSRT